MGLFKKFKAPKGKIELKLDEAAYEVTDKLTGRIALDPEEEMDVEEFKVEFSAERKTKFNHTSLSSSSSEDTRKISVGGSIKLQKGQHYEHPFKLDIPPYARPDAFTELSIKVKGVAAIKGRPDLTHEVKPAINLPYVITCRKGYGGCGYTTQPLMEPIKACPQCGNNLEESAKRFYKDELERQRSGPQRF